MNRVFVGNDQGYYGTKVVSRFGNRYTKLFVRNFTVPNRVGDISFNPDPHHILYRAGANEPEWLVGKLAIEQSREHDLQDSHERRLFRSSWFTEEEYLINFRVSTGLMLPEGETEPVVSVALPTDNFVRFRDPLRQRLLGKHRFMLRQGDTDYRTIEFTIKPENLFVISQPLATLFQLALDKDGQLLNVELLTEKISIHDLGYGTSDIETLDGETLIKRRSFTSSHSLRQVYQRLAEKLEAYTKGVDPDGVGRPYRLWKLTSIFDSGHISFKGKKHDLSNMVDECFDEVGQSLVTEVWDRLGFADDFQYLVLTGGGAKRFKKYYLQRFAQEKLLSAEEFGMDAMYAGASGLCKFAQAKINASLEDTDTNIFNEFKSPDK